MISRFPFHGLSFYIFIQNKLQSKVLKFLIQGLRQFIVFGGGGDHFFLTTGSQSEVFIKWSYPDLEKCASIRLH